MIAAWLMTGCNIYFVGLSSPQKDDISRAISEAVGTGMTYDFRGVSDGRIVYEYLIQDDEDKELINKLVEAVNEVLEEQSKKGKNNIIVIRLMGKDDGGKYVFGTYASLSNEYGEYNNKKKTSYLSELIVYGDSGFMKTEESCYREISAYTSLKGIKSLWIDENLAEQAGKEGIDFYEIWPELEYYEEF